MVSGGDGKRIVKDFRAAGFQTAESYDSGRFERWVRQRTQRRIPLKTKELIAELNPLLRGWGEYYKRAHVRKLFHRLDG